MTVLPHITTFGWVPEFARGFVCDLWPRLAFGERPSKSISLAMPGRLSDSAGGAINA